MFLGKVILHHLSSSRRILTFIAPSSFDYWNILDCSAHPYTFDPILSLSDRHSITFQVQICHHLLQYYFDSMISAEMRWYALEWYADSAILADNQIVCLVDANWHVNGMIFDTQIHGICAGIRVINVEFYDQQIRYHFSEEFARKSTRILFIL